METTILREKEYMNNVLVFKETKKNQRNYLLIGLYIIIIVGAFNVLIIITINLYLKVTGTYL